MGLVTTKEIANSLNLNKYGSFGVFLSWILIHTLRISYLNRVYDNHKKKKCPEFLDAILDDFQVKFEIPEDDFKRLPKEGPYITISNHPLGGIDGILLLKIMLEKVPNYKIIGNFLLHRIEPMKPHIMPVNPFEAHKEAHSSLLGIKETLRHLSEGNPLGVFPAGEVSTKKKGKIYVDKPWEKGALRLIQKAKVPVVPIYFHAKNSSFFYFLSKISGLLRTAKLPSELLSQKNRIIQIRIGNPISVREQDKYTNLKKYSDFLRKKTYMFSNFFAKESKSSENSKTKVIPKAIVTSGDRQKIIEEINSLRNPETRLFQTNNYEVFFAKSSLIPNIMNEIGRLREITFREVGEGTNEEIDLDEYDNYYHHLFLWDDDVKEIAGAYRMGLGNEIFPKYGLSGFYLNSLFGFEKELEPFMHQSIEMGRAFVTKEYQQKPMPLFLLWRGIIYITLLYPDHKYLIGGVSISNQFSDFSKSLIVSFLKTHYYDTKISQHIRPKLEYKPILSLIDNDFFEWKHDSNLNKFDTFINEIEPGPLRLPVLIKKYIKQNAKALAFNVDPLFNNAIDGLFYIDISDIPNDTIQPVAEEYKEILKNNQNIENK